MTFAEVLRVTNDAAGLVFLVLIVLVFGVAIRSLRASGSLSRLFETRRTRVERDFLVYRGPHYPRRTVKVRRGLLLPRRWRHRWGR